MNTPTWFKVVAVLALLWNLLGCLAFFSDLRLSPEDLAKLPEAQQALYAARAGWAVAATAIAVFGGVLGSIGLLVRKKWAFPVFALSLLGILIQDFGLFVLADGMEVAGAELENGLLTIRLTRKRPETRTKTIPIRTAGAKE